MRGYTMTAKRTKTALILCMLATFAMASVQYTAAISSDTPQHVDDSRMVTFLDNVIDKTGTTITEHTLDDSSVVTVTNTVTPTGSNTYIVQSIAAYRGVTINNETITVTKNADNTIHMINEKHGFNVVFGRGDSSGFNEHGQIQVRNSKTIHPLGSGSSDISGAKVDLYDSGYKATWEELLRLEDRYEQCNLRDYETSAVVLGNDYWTTVHWNFDQFYFHWCILGHSVDNGEISFQGNTYEWSGSSNRADYRDFSHGSNTGSFRVEADAWYGSW